MSVAAITMPSMTRWQPNARGRLEQAALELYGERGYENTTVAAIAERAGLTERTFFRYFADKREALFAGGDEVKDVLVAAVADAPEAMPPLDAAVGAFETVGVAIQEQRGRDFARRRRRIIIANAELHERELIKLAGWAAGVAEALRARGTDEPAAKLSAQVALAVFRTAFERWTEDPASPGLPQLIRESLDRLGTLSSFERSAPRS